MQINSKGAARVSWSHALSRHLQSLRTYWLQILLIAGFLPFIWLYRFPPLQDYPDWMYQGWVFSRLLSADAPKGYAMANFPVPNSTGTVVMGLFGLVLSPEIAGKIFLSVAVVVFAAGSLYLV